MMEKNKKSLQPRKPQAYSGKSWETSSNNDYSRKIYVGKKAVGEVVGDVFIKALHSRIHFLRKPLAIAFDVQSLHNAKALGAARVKINDLDTGFVYRASIDLIFSKGLRFNRGFGEQIALTLNYWDCQGQQSTGGPPPESPKFPHNMNTNSVVNKSKITNRGIQPHLFN